MLFLFLSRNFINQTNLLLLKFHIPRNYITLPTDSRYIKKVKYELHINRQCQKS